MCFFCVRLWALKVPILDSLWDPCTLCVQNSSRPTTSFTHNLHGTNSLRYLPSSTFGLRLISIYFLRIFKVPTSSWQTVSSPALFVVSKLANLFQSQIDVYLFSPHIFIKILNYQTKSQISIRFVRKQLEIENSFNSKSLNHSISVRLSIVTFVSLFSCCSKISERSTTEKVCSRTWISGWCPFCVRTVRYDKNLNYKIVDN